MIELVNNNILHFRKIFGRDVESGMALAIYLVLSRLPKNNYALKLDGNYFNIMSKNSYSIIPNHLVHYNVDKNFHLELETNNNEYYISVLNDENNYNIYKFNSESFIQGFISGFSYFDLDFRDFLYALPYKIVNNTKIYYVIEGYDAGWVPPHKEMLPTPYTIEAGII